MQNEKKLKVKSLLKLYTHSKGEINIKQFFSEFSEPSQENVIQNMGLVFHI